MGQKNHWWEKNNSSNKKLRQQRRYKTDWQKVNSWTYYSQFPPLTFTCSGATGTTLGSLRWDLRTCAAVRTQDSDSRAPDPNQRSSGTRDRSSTLSRTCQGNRPGSAVRPPTILFTWEGRERDGRPQAGRRHGGGSNTVSISVYTTCQHAWDNYWSSNLVYLTN